MKRINKINRMNIQNTNCQPFCDNKLCGGYDGCNGICNFKSLGRQNDTILKSGTINTVWLVKGNNFKYKYMVDTLNNLNTSTPSPQTTQIVFKPIDGGPTLNCKLQFDNEILIFQSGGSIIQGGTVFLLDKSINTYTSVGGQISISPINCQDSCFSFVNDDQNCGSCGKVCGLDEKCCGRKCIKLNKDDTCTLHDCEKVCGEDEINCAGECLSRDLVYDDCQCRKDFFTGDKCQDECSGHGKIIPSPLQPPGSPQVNYCACLGNWSGTYCEICPSLNFDNTDGTCSKCQNYYYGDKCENNCLSGTNIILYNYNNQTSFNYNLYNNNCCAVPLIKLLPDETNIITPIANLLTFITQHNLTKSSLLIVLVGNLSLTSSYNNLTKIDDKNYFVSGPDNKPIGPFDISITNNDTKQTVTYNNIKRLLFQGTCIDVGYNPIWADWACEISYSFEFDENDSQNYKKYSVDSKTPNLPEILLIGPEFSNDSRCSSTCKRGRCLSQSGTCPPNYDQTDPTCQKCANNWTGENCDICPPNFNPLNDCKGCINYWQGTNCDQCNGYYVDKTSENCNKCIPQPITLYDINGVSGGPTGLPNLPINLIDNNNCIVKQLQFNEDTYSKYAPIQYIRSVLNGIPISALVIILIGNLSVSTIVPTTSPGQSPSAFTPLPLRDYKNVLVVGNSDPPKTISLNLSVYNNDTGKVQIYKNLKRSVNVLGGKYYYSPSQFDDNESHNYYRISTPLNGGVGSLPEILVIGPEFNNF